MGMFDTVHFKCPKCNADIEEQTKVGKCNLSDYSSSSVPTIIAANMHDDPIWCTACDTQFKVYAQVVRRAELKLIEQS